MQSTEISIIIFLSYYGALHLMVYTGIRFYKYYGSLTLKNITGIRFYKYLWVSDPKKHSLFIGAEHRNICNNANQPDVKKVQSTEISIIILSTILRCAAPHGQHGYPVLQILRVSDPKDITGIRF